jgi:SAM-dependent methyltransferase
MTLRRVACSILMVLSFAAAQTAEDIERRIANLTPDEQAYERFRFWTTTHAPGQTDYRAYLKQRGFSDADIDAQLKSVATNGKAAEINRWNRILTAEKPVFNTKPNEFLVEMAKSRKPGTALDVGMGQGRNAIWLAQQGWDVTGFDVAEQAVALAQQTAAKLGVRFHAEVKDMEQFDFGEKRWDLILLSYVSPRRIAEIVQRALKPGGVLIVESFHRDATKGHSLGGGVVFDTGDLPKLYPQLRVVRYEEPIAPADFGNDKMRVVRYCGERPE